MYLPWRSSLVNLSNAIVVAGCVACASGCKRSEPVTEPQPAPAAPKPAVQVASVVPSSSPTETGGAALGSALLGIGRPEPEAVEAAVEANKPKPRKVRKNANAAGDETFVDDGPPPEVGLTDFDFQATVGDWRGMKSCLTQGMPRDETNNGALEVSFKIRADGQVAESKVFGETNEQARTIAPCVERSAKMIKFPAFDGEKEVVKVAKFVF